MDSKSRQPRFNLKEQLFSQSRQFSFIQVCRLLDLSLKEESNDQSSTTANVAPKQIRIRPELSLGFPSSDVAKIEEFATPESSGYQITATFLGLYGISSPLPTFYTENLFRDESEDHSLTREFIDVFNNHLYQLFFKIWQKHQLSYQLFEANDHTYLSYLYSLGGINDALAKLVPPKYNILRYLGIMGYLPRTTLGLKILLKDLLEIKQIEILECRYTLLPIPIDQQLCLGFSNSELGQSTHLGEQIISTNYAFTVQIGPISYQEYKGLLPKTEKFQLIKHIIQLYIDHPLIWDIELTVLSSQIPNTKLAIAQLGFNTWLFADGMPKKAKYRVVF